MLPNFESPRYEDLRSWWVRFPQPEVRRLILEVQTGRYALAEMRSLAEGALRETDKGTSRHKMLMKLVRQLNAEIQRVGRIYGAQQLSESEKERISRGPPVKP